MPGEVVGVAVDVEVAFPGPEVPGWDRSVTAAGVLHGRALPPGIGKAPPGTLVLIKALPVQTPAANGKMFVLKKGTAGRIHAPIDRAIGKTTAGNARMTGVSDEMNGKTIVLTAEVTFAKTIPMPGVSLLKVKQSPMHVTDGGTTGTIVWTDTKTAGIIGAVTILHTPIWHCPAHVR
jgi:hypothetical protein